MKKILVGTAIAILVIFYLINRSQVEKQPTPTVPTPLLETKTNQQGEVTVKVTPQSLIIGQKPAFEIIFDTHSVDLAFDPTLLVNLTDDQGTIYNRSLWQGSPSGGHHRSGILIFNQMLSQTKNVELVIKDVAGVKERKFRWQL